MQILIKIILILLGCILCVAVVLVPLTLIINNEFPDLINERKFLIVDTGIIGVTYAIGFAINNSTNKNKINPELDSGTKKLKS